MTKRQVLAAALAPMFGIPVDPVSCPYLLSASGLGYTMEEIENDGAKLKAVATNAILNLVIPADGPINA